MSCMTRIKPAPSCSRKGAVSVRCEASAAKVCFKLNKHIEFGQALAVVGSSPALGEWTPEKAVKLSWSEGDCWTGELSIPMGSALEYKYVVLAKTETKWQPCMNLTLIASELEMIVEDSWDSGRLSPAIEATTTAAVEEAPVTPMNAEEEAPATPIEEPVIVPEPVMAVIEEVVEKVEKVVETVVAEIPAAPLGNIVPAPSSASETKVGAGKSSLSKKAARRAQAGASKALAKGLEDK